MRAPTRAQLQIDRELIIRSEHAKRNSAAAAAPATFVTTNPLAQEIAKE